MEGEDMALLCGYCGNCGAELAWNGKRTWKRKRIVHINICQEPSINYFCNRDCKLDWIFKIQNLKIENGINSKWVKEEAKSLFEMAIIEDNTDDFLEKYLEENNLKILREA